MRISFDFDGTLSEKPMQELAKKFIQAGHDVIVTTRRRTKMGPVKFENEDLFKVTQELGIKAVIFTEFEDKYQAVEDCDIHFDDDEHEIYMINEWEGGKCLGFLYEHNYRRESGIINF